MPGIWRSDARQSFFLETASERCESIYDERTCARISEHGNIKSFSFQICALSDRGIHLVPNAKHLLLDVLEPGHRHNGVNGRTLYAINRFLILPFIPCCRWFWNHYFRS